MPIALRAALAATVILGTACGRTDTRCDSLTQEMPTRAGAHVSSCSSTACGYGNPPTSGDHCADLAACTVHTSPVSRCRYVHNLEHGHVVLAYNCPEGCPELVAQLETLRTRAKQDASGAYRALVTPDPGLNARVAVSVWGFAYAGDALDDEAVECLLARQDLRAPEQNYPCLR